VSVLLPPAAEALLIERDTCTLTTIRADGTPHVAPVRFTWDPTSGLARVMTVFNRAKSRNIRSRADSRAVACQVSEARWISLEGGAVVSTDPRRLAAGIQLYTKRYWTPPPTPPGLAVIEIAVDRVLGLY